MDKPESFEVTEYGDDAPDMYSVIQQIVADKVKESPAHGLMVAFSGGHLVLKYHCYEMHLPSRLKQVVDLSNDVFREAVSHIKKEYKRRTKKALTLKELKDLANYTTQKVSMNERYYVIFWRCYDLGLE